MWNKLKETVSNALSEGEKAISRAVDKSLFKRIIYAGYLVASADGDFDGDERSALAKIINKDLPQFEINDIIGIINECDSKVGFDKRMGTSEMMDFIGGASGDDAELIMRICCFIGESDGKFDQDEKLIARDIAVRLSVSPSRYGL